MGGNVVSLTRPVLAQDQGPTRERVNQAKAQGRVLVRESVAEEISTWRVSPVICELERRKTLLPEERKAAERFLKDYYLGLYCSPRTPGYTDRVQGGGGGDYGERRVHHAQEVRKAHAAVDPYFHWGLDWLVTTLGEGLPLSALGALYAPTVGIQTQSARGGQALAGACAMLCRHYGIQHRIEMAMEKSKGDLAQYLIGNMRDIS